MEKIFSYNPDLSKNAYMNWRMQTGNDAIAANLTAIAEGFSQAALHLIEEIYKDNTDKKADALVFPIMYSIDHAIELYLKAIIYTLEALMDIETNPNGYLTHDSKLLFDIVCTRIQEKEGEQKAKELQGLLHPVEDYIKELYSYIQTENKPQMDFARYPLDPTGKAHFYVCASENVVINLECLRASFSEIFENFQNLFLMYYDELDKKSRC